MSRESCAAVQNNRIERYDLTFIGDFSEHSDDCWRVAEEARCAADAGYSIGFVNVAAPAARLHPDIAACLFETLAAPAALDAWIETRILLIASPRRVGAAELRQRPHIRAQKAFAILSDWPASTAELGPVDEKLRFLFGLVQWSATTEKDL